MSDWKYNNTPAAQSDRETRRILQQIDLSDEARARKRAEFEKMLGTSNTILHAAQTCDGCGEETAARLKKCSRCESAYYCSSNCQKADWPAHKQLCPTLKAHCESTGKAVVDMFNNTNLPPMARVARIQRLDRQGPYTMAVKFGLHDAVRNLFKEEARLVQSRYEAGICCSWLHMVVCMLFRGQRREIKAGGFKRLDSSRVTGYIQSHVEAWDAWLDAAIVMSDMLLEMRNSSYRRSAHRAARDVWNTMLMVLTKPGPATAIFINEETKDDPVKLKARATRMAEKMRHALDTIAGATEAQDPNSFVEANMNQAAAMLVCWCTRLNIGVDLEAIYQLRGHRRSLYRAMAVPLAEATIQKGGTLSSVEYQIVMGQR